MSDGTTESWLRKLSKEENPVEAGLSVLQANNRLGIFSFENDDKNRLYPSDVLNDIASHNAHRRPLISMSFVPSQASNTSIIPFGITSVSHNSKLAYLFDLRTKVDNPAKVVRVFREMSFTGFDNYNKQFRLSDETGINYLDELYKKHNSNSLISDVFNDISLSAKQLDALGDYYESITDNAKANIKINELLVSVSKDNIAAIAVPISNDKSSNKTLLQLTGALSGLEHAKNGMNLPVVFYHILPHNKGQSKYIAQGEDECRKVACEALGNLSAQLSKVELKKVLSEIKEDINRLLGINIKDIKAKPNNKLFGLF